MAFTVLVPARLASTRLPRKPLADIAGTPMVVRVAQRAALSRAARVVVAADHEEILAACRAHGVDAILTRVDHPSGSDRLAEACMTLELDGDDVVVNVQGDEPLIEPSLIDACAALLARHGDCVVGTAASRVGSVDELANPNVVKVVCDQVGRALYFSRAALPWWRDGSSPGAPALSPAGALRHIGIYAYRAGFLRRFPTLAPSPLETTESLEQLRVLWHGERIAVHISELAAAIGVDTLEDLERVRSILARAPGQEEQPRD
jgi:3-deoxy-manno-octulosonate cytidylyltransferase (CMP-KDO synthetase)